MSRRPAKVEIPLVFVAHHAVHGVDGFIGKAQGCAPDQQIQQGGQNPVRKIFRHRLHGGLGDAFRREGGGVPPHNPAHLPPGRRQVPRFQRRVNPAALIGQALQSQRLPAPEQFHCKSQSRVNPMGQSADSRRQGKGAQRQHRRQHPPGRQQTGRGVGEQPPQQVFQPGNHLAHQHHRVGHPGRVGQQQIQSEAPQHRQRRQHPASGLVYWTVAR